MARVAKVHHTNSHAQHHAVKKGKRQVKKGVSENEVASDAKLARIRELVLRAQEWTSSRDVRNIVTKYGEAKLERMLMASERISKLSDDLGLTKKEIFKMARYIETKLPKKVKKGKAYLKKSHTGLARTIEFRTNRAFIHLKTHNVSPLGSGCHKRVTRSIMYAAHNPEIVANCVGDKTVKKEGRVLKKLKRADGIAKTYAVGSHKKRNGKKVYSIITKLYNAHTVRSYEWNRSSLENPNDELYIARDLMKGLESMHAKRLAHRDLHSGNFMVHRTEDKVSAALIDFGQVVSFDKAKKMVPRIEVSRHLITPESLIKGKHRVDVRKIESFAVGCSLYHLYFGKAPEWTEKLKQINVKYLNSKKKKQLSHHLAHEIRQTIERRKNDLNGVSNEQKVLGEVILKLLDPDPKKRFAPHLAREMLDSVISQLNR